MSTKTKVQEIGAQIKTLKNLIREKKAQMPGSNILPVGVTIIAMLIIAFVGVMISNSIHSATKLTCVNFSNGTCDTMYNASQGLLTTTGTVFSMYGVLIIVLVAAVIIGLLLSSFLGGGREE